MKRNFRFNNIIKKHLASSLSALSLMMCATVLAGNSILWFGEPTPPQDILNDNSNR